MGDHRRFILTTTLVLTACWRLNGFAADYYVDTVYGSDNNDGLSPGLAFSTLNKGFSSAYAANIAAGTNGQGYCLGSSSVHLLPGSENLRFFWGDKFVEGDIDMIGEQDAASDVSFETNLHIASRLWTHPNSPLNGTLFLRNINFRQISNASACLYIGCNQGYPGSMLGQLRTEGGDFVWHSPGGLSHVGMYNNWTDYTNNVNGSLVFGEGTTSASMIFKDFLVGYRLQIANRADGLVDGRAVAGGSLVVSNTFSVGMNGHPAIGNVLLGGDWTLHVGSGAGNENMTIGKGGNACLTTGIVSFAKGGVFTADVNELSVGYGVGNTDCDVYGQLLGGEGTDVGIACSQFVVGVSSPLGSTEGRIDFTGSDGGTLLVTSQCKIGVRSGACGEVLLGEDWDVEIGSATAPLAEMLVGYGWGSRGATGLVSMASGSFKAYAETVKMGCEKSPLAYSQLLTGTSDFSLQAQKALIATEQDGQPVYAEIDASASTNAVVDLGTLYLAYGASWWNAEFIGRLALGHGAGSVGSIYMGLGYDPREGLCGSRLELNGFEMTVTNRLEIRKSGQVRVSVDGKSSGPSLASNASMVFQDTRTAVSGPAILVNFNALPEGKRRASVSTYDEILWGFKIGGDQVANVNQWIADGWIAYEASGFDETTKNATGVFYDAATDATYIGLYTRTAKDPTVFLMR